MSKTKINYFVDILILGAFLLTGLSGIILLMLPGERGLSQYVILGITRAGWVGLHDWAGIGMIIGVFLHFVLHWKWLVYMTRNIFRGLWPTTAEQRCPVAVKMDQ